MSDRYLVVIENTGHNYSAYIPDLPGCVATGDTIEGTVRSIREAMAFHLEALRRDGERVPAPVTYLSDPNLALTHDAIGVIEVNARAPLAA